MPIARSLAIALCLAPLAATAQTAPRQEEPDIVVNGEPGEQKSDWKRAEGDHVIVYSDGDEAQLVRVTNNLERLYRLMSRLYRKGDTSDDTARLQVTLYDSASFFDRMDLRNLRWSEGPFAPGIAGQGYYDPREDGEVLALARSDQMIKLNTKKAFDQDCDEALAEGADNCSKMPYHYPAVREWEALLYSAFAQRFLLTYTQKIYPRWYVDGIGALFSTMDVRRDGSIDYATAPPSYRQVFRSYGNLNVADVLTGRYLEPAPGKGRRMDWTPYHAWLLVHYFSLSNLPPARAAQFRRYMAAIHRGVPLAEAAQAFGDMKRLQHDLEMYAERPITYARTARPTAPSGADPLVSRLSLASAAVIDARIELGVRLATLPDTADAAATRDRWLDRLRARVAALPYDSDALLVVTEAECRAGRADACLADAERVLAYAPDDARALVWKGVAQTDRAIAGPAAARSQGLVAARATLVQAIKLDGQATLPQIAWFQSYTKAGERAPREAMLAMARVVQRIPAAPAPRLYLGEELYRQGNASLARQILQPVLYGASDSPEKRAAMLLFAPPGSTNRNTR